MDIETPAPEARPENRPKADDAALELMKQIITLASGVLALGAAFVDKLPKTPKYFLAFSAVSTTELGMAREVAAFPLNHR